MAQYNKLLYNTNIKPLRKGWISTAKTSFKIARQLVARHYTPCSVEAAYKKPRLPLVFSIKSAVDLYAKLLSTRGLARDYLSSLASSPSGGGPMLLVRYYSALAGGARIKRRIGHGCRHELDLRRDLG